MSTRRNLFGALLGALACIAFLAGCPENDDPEVSCAFDSQCDEDQVCVAQRCEFTCESEADCFGDEVCQMRDDGEGTESICVAPVQTGCDQESDPTQYCIDQLGDEEAFCFNNVCQLPGDDTTYYVAYVHDVTTDRCDDTTYDIPTDGSKLMHIALVDGDTGSYIAYGAAVEYYYGNDEVFYGDVMDVLDGTAPDYDSMCPLIESHDHSVQDSNFREDAVVAIGCGGEVFVRFYDSAGNGIPIESGDIIEVNEYGPFCSDQNNHTTQSGDDFYDVYVCPGPDVSQTQAEGIETDITTCLKLNAAPATGLTDHLVSLP
jgi:hypothetical protein